MVYRVWIGGFLGFVVEFKMLGCLLSNGLNRGRTEQGTKYSRVLVIAEEDWRIEIILLMPRYWPRFLNKTRVIGSEAISDN